MIDYKQEIANYGKRLPTEEEKEIARNIFQRLYNKGFDFEFIYYAIKHLNGKNLADNIGLMFYKDFQEEVKLIIKNERRKEKEKQEQIKRIGEAYERFANQKPITIYIKPETEEEKAKKRKARQIDLDSIALSCDE